jgi:subtilisin family serine protease/O-antigen ligase
MERLERIEPGWLLSVSRRYRIASVLAVCLLAGLMAGALVTVATAPVALALGAAMVGGLILLRSPLLGLLAVIGVVILLPFAAVPLGIGFNPTFLNLALLATLTVWVVRAALGQERPVVPPLAPAILGFMLMALLAFVLGLGHVRPTPAVLRHFGEFILAIVFALLLVNILGTEARITRATQVIIVAGGAAAFVGTLLYVLPDHIALRLLSPLRYLEYNVALRYIRDDPSLPERAIGTSVDPNAFGGLLVLLTALTAAQVFAPRPLLPRWLVAALSLLMGITLVLTFSRSAMAGLLVSLGIIGLLRYRRLLLWLALAAVVFLVLPQTQGYIQHFIAGVRGEDLATQMRFGEYSDAFRLILRHPWFGVGFAGVPEIDIYLGVSSLYLLLAEYMGLVGLGVFVVMMALFFLHVGKHWQTMTNECLRPIVLGTGAGLAGAMVSGVLDHYFVNISFPHAVTLFWLFVGLALAATYVASEQSSAEADSSVGDSVARRPAHAVAVGRALTGLPLVMAVLIPIAALGLSMIGAGRVARADAPAPVEAAPRPAPAEAGAMALRALDPANLPKIDPQLAKQALEHPDTPQRFLVYLRQRAKLDDAALQALSATDRRRAMVEQLQAVADTSQRGVRAYLVQAEADGHVQDYKPFWIVNGVAVQGDAVAIAELAARAEVARVRADRRHMLPEPDQVPGTYTAMPGDELEWGVRRVQADVAWSALGIDGSGVVIASLDTGVDWLHPDLKEGYRGYSDKGLPVHTGNWYSVTDEDYQYPGDGNGHGTHTTATMAGRGGVGVAPGATWIAVKVFHNQGHTFDSWLHDAFQWVLAPAGNPDLAPDVVNGSWGTDFGADETLRDDIRLLRAAGIIPVFSMGNNGPDEASIGSPASFPEVLAVGAVDQDDEVARFSSRGPSIWGEIKPEVVAPGTRVQSAVPGGGRQAWNGTSMAAPHVTGVVALLLQADPGLTQDEIERLLETTATPVGGAVPNNDAGWGLVNAYRAVASAAHAGFISGQVRRAIDGAPIAHATVTIAERDGLPFAHATTDADGHYELALPPGPYQLDVSAFGFESSSASGIRVSEGAQTGRDISLDLSPVGVLTGRVADAVTGGPLAAEVQVVGTPAVAEAGGSTPGQYALSLPPGEYELRVVSQNHKVGHATVSIAAGESIVQDFELAVAPSILVVDSGAWYYHSQADYVEEALDDLDFPHDLWRIKKVEQDLPTADLLKNYDITIWSAPEDAPGLIGASSAITRYLEAGGRLLLTGQDVGYWDGGGSRDFFASYYGDYLRAAYVRDDADFRVVRGASGGPYEGMVTGIGRGDSAHNQWYPDEIAVTDPAFGRSALYYGDPEFSATDRVAGMTVGGCLPYRAVYLAFGLEGVDTAAERAKLLARSIAVLMAPVPFATLAPALPYLTSRCTTLRGRLNFGTPTLQNRWRMASRLRRARRPPLACKLRSRLPRPVALQIMSRSGLRRARWSTVNQLSIL